MQTIYYLLASSDYIDHYLVDPNVFNEDYSGFYDNLMEAVVSAEDYVKYGCRNAILIAEVIRIVLPNTICYKDYEHWTEFNTNDDVEIERNHKIFKSNYQSIVDLLIYAYDTDINGIIENSIKIRFGQKGELRSTFEKDFDFQDDIDEYLTDIKKEELEGFSSDKATEFICDVIFQSNGKKAYEIFKPAVAKLISEDINLGKE